MNLLRQPLVWLILLLGAILAVKSTGPFESQAEAVRDRELQLATFAGGCFWCMEPPFEKLEGVHSVVSGFAGGTKANPSYNEVASGSTDFIEAVQISYNPDEITYGKLLEIFWMNIDPTDAGGQFVDRGRQYTTKIFYHDADQKELALKSKKKLSDLDILEEPIVTGVAAFTNFYPAEEYHQDFYKKSTLRYRSYRAGSGRDQFIKATWEGKDYDLSVDLDRPKKPSKEELKQKLSEIQYYVTQRDGTEPPFNNEYWDNKAAGIYVDVVSGEPLFSSTDKFKSGTGWPSFTKPLVTENVVTKSDRGLGMTRTEVRSKEADSHLGHLFKDGPAPTGDRYCINSAALKFIPADKLEAEGYSEFASLFQTKNN